MDMSQYIDSMVVLAKSHPYIAGAAAIVIILAIYLRPKFFFGVFFLGVVAIGVVYIIMSASSGSVSQKKKLLREATIPQQRTLLHDMRSLRMPSFKTGILD